MARANEIGVGLAALGIAAAFAAGVFAGRSAAQLVEEDFARVAARTARTGLRERAWFVREHTAADGEPARYKIAVTQAQPSAGPSDALVTIVEWCTPYGEPCREIDSLLTAALEHRPLDVRRVFRGLVRAPGDALVLEVAHAAEQHGKFWELRERLSQLDSAPSLAELQAHIEAIGVKWPSVKRALERRTYDGSVAADRELANAVGVRGAAALYVNGRPVEGEITVEKLSALIEEEAARARTLLNDGAPREHIYAEIIKPAAWRSVRSSL